MTTVDVGERFEWMERDARNKRCQRYQSIRAHQRVLGKATHVADRADRMCQRLESGWAASASCSTSVFDAIRKRVTRVWFVHR